MQAEFGIHTYDEITYDMACSASGGTKCPPVTTNGYIDVRSCITSVEHMQACLEVYTNASVAENVLVVSLGDEIGVSDPNPNHTTPAAFAAWCTAQGHAGKPGCGGAVDTALGSAKGDVTTNGHYYYSLRFTHDMGILRYKQLTDKIKSMLPNALVGANYSPTGYVRTRAIPTTR